MTLPLDVARCTGQTCPSAMQCRRYVERIVPKGTISRYAAWATRCAMIATGFMTHNAEITGLSVAKVRVD